VSIKQLLERLNYLKRKPFTDNEILNNFVKKVTVIRSVPERNPDND
jgi:hypothetical protein